MPDAMPPDSPSINTRSKPQNTYDAIVVGSGISGGWAAKELCEKGLKTIMLERGRNIEHIKDIVAMQQTYAKVSGISEILKVTDLVGDEWDVLCVKGSGWDMSNIEPPGLPAVRLAPIQKLRAREKLSDEDITAVVAYVRTLKKK
jgi:choline dehydrogenase-like flavoprotein